MPAPSAAPLRIEYPPELPVSAHRDGLLAAIRDHQVVVVAGETGSGKTTQLPKLCLELGRQAIAHTQPRRIAARSVAERIAQELQVPLGTAVGYAVRFSDRSRADTRVRLMTDGLLLAEIQHDRQLRRYDTIVVDEAHERSLNVDFLLGCVKRILPRRPELKLIVTSATIDPQRFSEHFGGAPVVEVSGRTYPVEQRYRPLGDDRDQADAIGDAVEELLALGPDGDVLVFLSGEREIRDTADALRGRLKRARQEVELLPLYARLSSAEQQRVFQPHRGRRIVLATNVAETSLTVPGIRCVIDPGTARISRYSARLKVQRLPIEPISQASAAQRAGRCGRTADGICIRLYSEEDHDARPRFTDPEILRTSLASVILQMAALGLGAVEDFPFMDPPDQRQVRDGILLLQELGALDAERRLTGLGRRLARLPVDPRLGRMVLEGGKLGCAEEAIVIAAALSIQDPRERPAERREQAGALHARFDDPDSDFVAYLRLWDHLREGRRELSGNQFRKRCREEHLHPLRVREWQDLAAQLRGAARGAARVAINEQPAEPELIHRALLAGLLSHVGIKDAHGDGGARERGRRGPVEYAGARGARFALSRDSALSKRTPSWVMVAELVETNRLWGHTAARIDPRWIEPLAGHVVRRSHGDPRWDRRRGAAVVSERVTLYGLPIVDGRAVGLARLDPALARLLFIRHALVEGDWDGGRYPFVAENGRRVAQAVELEERARRRGLVAGEDARCAFFEERVPAGVASAADFERWWRSASAGERAALVYPSELLAPPEAVAAVSGSDWPQVWPQGELELALAYRFEPGAEHDGVTVRVPLALLGHVRPDGFDWLVPGLRLELVTTLIRSLPKELRRALVPAPEVAAAALARLAPQAPEAAAAPSEPSAARAVAPSEPSAAGAVAPSALRASGAPVPPPLLDALERALEALRGVRIPREAWDLPRLGPHLRIRFRVEDERGETLAEGEHLDALREAVRPRLRAQLSAAAPELQRTGLRAWTIGALPREVELPGTAGAARAHPALVDEGETAGVKLFDTPAAQTAAMRAGTRRLLLCTMPQTVRYVRDHVDPATRLALAAAPGDAAAIVDDALDAATDALVAEAGGPAWDEAGFASLRAHVAGELAQRASELLAQAVRVLDAARAVQQRLDALARAPAPFQPARDDVEAQLHRLAGAGFVAHAGADRLPDLERYLRAAERRLERLADQLGADRDRMAAIHELEAAVKQRITMLPPGVPPPDALHEARWLVEELRVSAFAQALGVRGRASEKRVRALLRDVA